MPVLYDPHHLLTELYAISNVPTVVWIDEDDRIVRPNAEAFGTDTFADFTGAESEPHLELVRRWVRYGEVPDPSARGAAARWPTCPRTRCWPACTSGWPPKRTDAGDAATTRPHVLEAGALAPDDLTMWRAGMPLVGEDPFGQDVPRSLRRLEGPGKPGPCPAQGPGDRTGGGAGHRGRRMRVVIDPDLCTGHGRCYALAPSVFGCDDSGFGTVVLDGDLEGDDLRLAELVVANCPERAVLLVDTPPPG